MPSYRFCRSDDVPLLVDAYNACYSIHYPEEPPLTVAALKEAVQELDLWTSSCMVALADELPIAVLLAAKRDEESWIYRLGVHPEHQRHDHGSHLLQSLSQKMAILGPPRLRAEVPEDCLGSCRFLEACGYGLDRTYTDFAASGRSDGIQRSELVTEISYDELEAAGVLDEGGDSCWTRSPRTLAQRREELRAVVLASDLRVEGCLLYDQPEEGANRRVLGLRSVDPQRTEPILSLLLRHLLQETAGKVTLYHLMPGEVPPKLLARLGFEPVREIRGYLHVATAA